MSFGVDHSVEATCVRGVKPARAFCVNCQYRTPVLYWVMPPRRDQRPTNVAYYAKNRDREIRRVRDRQDATVRFLRQLRERPCVDCGGVFEPHQMDFDHRDPRTKSFKVTTGRAMLMSTDRLLAEVGKCDVVCANCHRIRSWKAQLERLEALPPEARTGRADYLRLRYRSRVEILNRLRDRPCGDCGARYPPCAVDFDHIDAPAKTNAVSRMASNSLERMLAEANKCDIVCANCHRMRTYVRRVNRALAGGSNSVGRVRSFQDRRRGFESRLPLHSS